MKKKYYLRGLGFGILITTLVFALIRDEDPTEEEIIRRAEELGYVKAEEQVTPSLDLDALKEQLTSTPKPTEAPTPTKMPIPTVASTPTETPIPTETPTPIETPIPTPTPTPTPTEMPTPTAEPTKAPDSGNDVVIADIKVERGNTATVVCEKIEAAGIVKDGNDLKNYLIRKNLTDYINIGTYTLSSEMSYEQIAKILTGR
ncbi:MAG: hypothetical protein ACI4FZ_09330 [Lachnospiraceae bacterium]